MFSATETEKLSRAGEQLSRLKNNISRVMVGKEAAVDLMLAALLSKGHVLLEDVPGVGKTMLVKTLAASLDCSFKRIQFTPDLLPSDVTGVSIYNQKSGEFQFTPGPVMANLVLADEINRATPRTQSSLLEAMEERQVTVEGTTYPLEEPFLVVATQNPVEQEGTFPLPEAQLDRFFLKLALGYPDKEQEKEILARFAAGDPYRELQPVLNQRQVIEIQESRRLVHLSAEIQDYIVALVQATRREEALALGASPRAGLALYRGAQALALIRGRDFCRPDDIKELFLPILCHRVILTVEERLKGNRVEDLLSKILSTVPVPVEEDEI